MLNRAYSTLEIKSVDADRRVITGTASTPSVDRVGDVVVPSGAKFAPTIPLLLHHDSRLPVGSASLKAGRDAITFTAEFPDPESIESDTLRERVKEAWSSIKAKIIRGVSIGFNVLEDGAERMKDGGLRFTKFEILELSLVAVPANQDATISTIKSIDAGHLAASGNDGGVNLPGVSGFRVKTTRKAPMKTVTEQKAAFVAEKEAKVAKMNELMAGADAGATLDEAKQEEFDTLGAEIEAIDNHLARLETLERVNKTTAKAVDGMTVEKAAAARSGAAPVITVKENTPPGIGFARAVMCKTLAQIDHRNVAEIAKEKYPHDDRLQSHFKAAVPAGTSTQADWASSLVYADNLASEFVEYLRPQTILGKFGTGNVPALRRVPFNVRFASQTSGGTGYWVGEGAPKPLTSFAFDSSSLGYTKVAAISVITEELARFSTPSAEMLVRDALAAALIERLDIDFIDPASAASSGVRPASITNGLTALTSAGTSADNARTDVTAIVKEFIEANMNATGLVFIMPNTLALALSIMVNSLGQPEFPGLGVNGGNLLGIPVITSQYAANSSGAGNLVIAVAASELFLADDGQVRVDASREASLQMSDAPTGGSGSGSGASLVSMYQTNSIALRAERFINWSKRRSNAVVYMDDVNWGSVGSPS